MKKNVVIALTLMLAVILCACANNDASQRTILTRTIRLHGPILMMMENTYLPSSN